MLKLVYATKACLYLRICIAVKAMSKVKQYVLAFAKEILLDDEKLSDTL